MNEYHQQGYFLPFEEECRLNVLIQESLAKVEFQNE